MSIQRRTGGSDWLTALTLCANVAVFDRQSTDDDAAIGNGSTAGNLRTVNVADYQIDGIKRTKAATDDLWDLSAEVDTPALTFRSYWLYIDAAGAATFVAGAEALSEVLAKAALPEIDLALSIFGVYTAGAATDFDNAGGLAAQGTIDDGVPTGVPGKESVPDPLRLVAP